MTNLDKLAQTLVEPIPDRGTSPYETNATVIRLEDGMAWVQIPGGVEETPAVLAVAALPGDEVRVRVTGGKAYITGNPSAPPTDDALAEKAQANALRATESAMNAMQQAEVAHDAADNAVESANTAKTAADSAVADAATAKEAAGTAQEAVNTVNENLKSVVTGAQTVEKAVSVMQTALEAVVEYDPDDDSVQEYFWHDANGAHVLGTSGDYRADIKSTGMNIVDTATENAVATFGSSGVKIGLDEDTHINVNYHSMQLIDKDGNEYFHVSDLRNASGVAQVTDTFEGGESAYWLSYTATSTDYTVTVSDGSGGNVYKYDNRFIFGNETNPDATVTAEYETESDEAKAYTIGMRETNSEVGASSVVIGTRCVASSKYSYAEGYQTTASGYDVVHAEGYQTLASGGFSHAEGNNTTADGFNSHAQNRGTYAATRSQTVIGEYNEIDEGGGINNRGDYALIIGNGTSGNSPSNALTVDWLGGVEMYLDHNGTSSSDATSGTDKDLFNAIRALGWYSDVIV